MSNIIITAATTEPISVGEAKHYLRVDGTLDDQLIEGLIVAARQYCEAKTKRVYCTTTLEYGLDTFPSSRVIELPSPPLVSVTSVKYYDTSDELQTMDSTAYDVDIDSEPGRIVMKDDEQYPSIQSRENAVVIRYVAGYGDATDVPDVVKSAMYLLLGHWYENRCGVVTGTIATTLPMGVKALLSSNSFGWYA